jgi:RNA polymerase sigma factor (sigma-70 family)
MVDDGHDGTAEAAVEEQRLRCALARDLDAGFAEVTRVHGDVVHSVARNLIRRADAEDLAAESLLKAYRALRGFDAVRIKTLSIRPWLLTILRNTARNAARDAARRPGPPPTFEPSTEQTEPEPAAGPAERAEQLDTQRRLGAVLAELPEAQRTAIVLRHVVGLPIGEIAEILGCRDGTAKSHISRGLQRLRTLLTDTTTTTEAAREGTAVVVVGGTAQRVLRSGRRSR